jgi:hypothetical protein
MAKIELMIDTPSDPNKENLLFLFKYHSRWNIHVIRILEEEYNVYYHYFTGIYQQIGTKKLCEFVRNLRLELNLKALIIDSESCDVFNIATVELLDAIMPVGLLLLDDSPFHEFNRILASRASFVLAGCPLAVMKYRELDIEVANFCPHYDQIYLTDNTPPEYDVLWYGYHSKVDRLSFISKLQDMTDIKVKIYTGPTHNNTVMSGDLSYEELSKMIANAKITINLTKSDFPFRVCGYSTIPRPEIRYLVGRFIEVGFAGRLCISQYSPIHELFPELTKYMKEFHTPDQMVELIRYTLASGRLEEETVQYSSYIKRTFDSRIFARNARMLIDRANISHWRPITRVNQNYYNIASSAITRFPFQNLDMRVEELDLLNQACGRVRFDFTVEGESPTRTCDAKIFIPR